MGNRIKRIEDNKRINEKFFAVPLRSAHDPLKPDMANAAAAKSRQTKKPPTRKG